MIPQLPADNGVNRVRDLTRQRRFGEALACAEALSAEKPGDRDALYLLAVNQRCTNRIPAALKTLDQLEREHPDLSRLHQERGFCFLSMRDSARAIAALERAVTRNPALTASWSALEKLYLLAGDPANAAAAGERVSALNCIPAQVVQAGSHLSEGDFGAAEALVRAHLAKDGNDVEALRLLARIEQQRDALDEAEELLETALKLAPDYRALRLNLAQVRIGRQKYLQARELLQALLQLEPRNAEYRTLHATACAGLGDHESAVAQYRAILAEGSGSPHLHLLLGHSLKASGRRTEAIESYHAARSARPDFGDAYWSLANLKTHHFGDADIAGMQDAVSAPATSSVDRLHLHFALGKALEMRSRYAESWQHYERGNAMRREQSRYLPEYTEVNTARQIEVCTPRFFADRAQAGAPDPDPIFIVGLPRSGSTLVEQILASHSLVAGTQELHDIPRLAQALQGRSQPTDPAYPGALRDLGCAQLRALGERYLADTRAYRGAKPDAPYFTDKMPNNFRHVGLVHLMLPNAKIIDVRREPMACCFGNFKQLYAGGYEFSYDLEWMGRYYGTYLELMRHWDRVLPGRVHRVLYEDLVEDLEGTVRRLLDFCALPVEPACLEFHRTVRSIGTASSEQVRRPINRDGLDEWAHYRPWLKPLEDALGDALVMGSTTLRNRR